MNPNKFLYHVQKHWTMIPPSLIDDWQRALAPFDSEQLTRILDRMIKDVPYAKVRLGDVHNAARKLGYIQSKHTRINNPQATLGVNDAQEASPEEQEANRRAYAALKRKYPRHFKPFRDRYPDLYRKLKARHPGQFA